MTDATLDQNRQSRDRYVGAAFLIAQPLLLNLISIPATGFIIYRLGSTGFGIFSTAIVIVTVCSVLANLGLRTLFIRDLSRSRDNATDITSIQLSLRLVLALLAAIISVVVAVSLHFGSGAREIIDCTAIGAVGMLLATVSTFCADVLQSYQKFRALAQANFLAGLLLTVVSVIVVALHPNVILLSAAYLVGPFVSASQLMWLANKTCCKIRLQWNFKRFAALLYEVRHISGNVILAVTQDRIEQVLVPKMLGVGLNGYFAAGTMLANRLVVFPDGLSSAFYPKLSEAGAHGAKNAAPIVRRLLTTSIVICIFLAFLVGILAGPISTLLFHKSPELCRNIMVITMWSLPIVGLTLPMSYALQSIGKHVVAARLNIVAIIAGAILSFVLIYFHGLTGAAWSIVLRPAIACVLLTGAVYRNFPTVPADIPWLSILTSATVACTGPWALTAMHVPLLLAVAGSALLATPMYFATLFLTGVITREEIAMVIPVPKRA